MKQDSQPGNAELQVGSGSPACPENTAELELGAPGVVGASGVVGAPGITGVRGETGAPGAMWRSRGYLPHCDQPGRLQSITFRLADSLPQEKLRQLEEELALQPEPSRDVARRKHIEQWLDAGTGCCVLRHPPVADIMEQALLHFDGDRYRLIAWCVMPNHVHVLIEPASGLARIVQSWKSYTGRWILAHAAELELGVPGQSLWMREYWDRYIRDAGHLAQTVRYIHENPVKARLCTRAEEWRWSSARRTESPGNPELQLGPSPHP